MSMPSAPPYIKFSHFILSVGGDTVDIPRQAAYGNNFDLTKVRIFNDSGDYIISFRDPLWPKYDVLTFDIFPITKIKADELEAFMIEHVGELINITLENIVYNGIIQDPKLELIDEKSDNCNYKVSFIFETVTCI